MEAQELHRGRLIDHIQLVVRDLDASRRFYEAVLKVLGIPIGGTADTYFWADELFVSSANSEAAQGTLTGRHHLAFQARDRGWWTRSIKLALHMGERTMDRQANDRTTQGTMRPSSSIRTATISRLCTTVRQPGVLPQSR